MRSKYMSDYVYLAEASYADFSGISINNGNNSDNSAIETRIVNTNQENSKPESFAKLVTDHYTVQAHWHDRTDESSFSATLFQNKETNKYVLAMKGTKELVDDLIITDGGI